MWHAMNTTPLGHHIQIRNVMNSRTDLLFVSIHGAFLTFDPMASVTDTSEAATTEKKTAAKKSACGKCTICKCKRALGMG